MYVPCIVTTPCTCTTTWETSRPLAILSSSSPEPACVYHNSWLKGELPERTEQINSNLYEGHENKNNFNMGRLNYRYQKRDSTPATAASSAPVILFEKNVLTCVTFLLFIGLAIWLVAVATDFWIVPVVLLSGSLNGGLEIEAQNRTFLWSHSGMWRRCDYYRTASATVSLFLTKEYMHFNLCILSTTYK